MGDRPAALRKFCRFYNVLSMSRNHPRLYYSRTLKEAMLGKSEYTKGLFNQFVKEYKKIGTVSVEPSKTMIAVATKKKGIAYVTQLGKNFIHIVFVFRIPHADNLCFQKIVQAYGKNRFNHHCRIFFKEDINSEVRKFMKLAYQGEE